MRRSQLYHNRNPKHVTWSVHATYEPVGDYAWHAVCTSHHSHIDEVLHFRTYVYVNSHIYAW